MKKRFSEEQIIGFLREAEAGVAVKELCRRHGFSDASFYLLRNKFAGMGVSDAKRLRELETASTSTGSLACCKRGRSSKPGGANTTTKDPRRHSAD